MTIEEKLQHLQASAMEEARAEANKILDDYQQTLDNIYEEYKTTVVEQAELTVKAETANVEHTINKALAKEQLKFKKELTKRHMELKKHIFTEAKKLLTNFKKTPDYDTLLMRQLKRAEDFAKGSEFHVYIDPSDKDKLESLIEETGLDIRLSKESFYGGTRAVIPSKNILIEESFESKTKEAFENFSFSGGHTHG